MKLVNAKVSGVLLRRLDAAARTRGRSRSALIREGIERVLADEPSAGRGPVAGRDEALALLSDYARGGSVSAAIALEKALRETRDVDARGTVHAIETALTRRQLS
jgi:Ribbon-helix-helix protein, copG family